MINHTIYTHKIAILAIQETHLTPQMAETINTCFRKNLEIHFSTPAEAQQVSAGVAFVINKALITPRKIKTYELTPGRALAMKIKWLESHETTLLNVYAPNMKSAHQAFWDNIDSRRIQESLPIPNFVLGDFNVTEDLIDHAPV